MDLFSFEDRPHFNVAQVRPESWLNVQRASSTAVAAAAAVTAAAGTSEPSGGSERGGGRGGGDGDGDGGCDDGSGSDDGGGNVGGGGRGASTSSVDGGCEVRSSDRHRRRWSDGDAAAAAAAATAADSASRAGEAGTPLRAQCRARETVPAGGPPEPWTFVFQFMNPGSPLHLAPRTLNTRV